MGKPTKHRGKWRIRWVDHARQRQSQVFDRYRDAEQALHRHQVGAPPVMSTTGICIRSSYWNHHTNASACPFRRRAQTPLSAQRLHAK